MSGIIKPDEAAPLEAGPILEVPNEFALPSDAQLRQLAGGDINPMAFDPPGPVGEAYMFGLAPIEFIMGPVGSAKTTCSIFRALIMSLRMPICKDDVIRARGCVVHQNLRALYRTALPSLFQFFPQGAPGVEYSGGQDRPFQFILRFMTPNGKKVQIIIDGFGITADSMENLLRGYQANWAWCVEADLLDGEVPPFLYSRVAQGRYPGRGLLKDHDAEIPGSVWGDLNPPLISNYVHEDFVENRRPGYVLHRQPSGLSDKAENRKFTRHADYVKLKAVLKKDKGRRMVDGEFGTKGDGALVYEEYDFDIHCAKQPLQPLDLPLLLGLDAGGSPAAIIGQYTPKGQMRWLAELCADPGTGVGRFAEMLIALLQSKFRSLPIGHAWGDPSAFHGADLIAGELSFMETVGKALNQIVLPTATNEPTMRQESVAYVLRQKVDAEGFPYFQHCPTMKMILSGFQGNFLQVKNQHDTADKVRFVKNKWSHPHEAGQYMAYGVRGHAGVINDAARAGRVGDNVVPIGSIRVNSDFNP